MSVNVRLPMNLREEGHPMRLLLAVVAVSLSLGATPKAPTTTQAKGKSYSDAKKTFTVSASSAWRKNEQLEKANKQVVLALGYGKAEEGKVQPTFFVLDMGAAAGELDD